MGFFKNLKKGAGSYVDAYNRSDFKKNRDAQKKYKKDVAEEVKKVRRKAFKIEAVKQAGLKARIQAKQKFNPSPQIRQSGGGMTPQARALIYGSGMPTPQIKQKVVQKIVQRRKKKKKKKPQKVRTIIKYIEKPSSNDALNKLLYGT